MKIKKLLEQLISKKELTPVEMQDFMQDCMSGQLSDVQIASILVLLRMKGETVEELTTAAQIMMNFAHRIDLGPDLIDIVGTGGDGKDTFNISTLTAFVAAAAGARVAKHGGTASSSRSGSADLLKEAGFVLELDDNQIRECISQCGISFLFAPHFHKSMLHTKNARLQLGIRTIFNLLGPLVNPASVKKQVVGVFSNHWLKPLAQVLANLGREHVFVVSSRDGLDEISISAVTDVVEYHQGEFKSWSINPKDFGCFHSNLDDIIVKSPKQSLEITKHVLDGQTGAARDIVLLNSALALYCAGIAQNFTEGFEKAKKAIDSNEAAKRFEQLRELTKQLSVNRG